MASTATPVYSAPHNGLLGDASAIAGAGQVNQFLGAHADTPVYPGTAILTPNGTGGPLWFFSLEALDIDQPFTMSGTGVGRVAVPLLPVGNGADLLVSLCSDNSGAPGTVLNQTRIPAAWISQLAAVSGTAAGSSYTTGLTGSTLAAGQFNWPHLGTLEAVNWPYPYTTSTAAASATYYGGYMVQAGGVAGGTAITNVFTIPYAQAGKFGVLSEAIPQASFPTTFDGSGKTCVVIDAVTGGPVVVVAGGGTTFGGAATAAVYTSSLNTSTGSLSAWSTQTALPATLQNQATCSYNGFVYEIGGIPSPGGNPVTTVYYAQVQNGQITGWSSATPFPVALSLAFAVATQGFLFVIGGVPAAGGGVTSVWYAPINADGSLGSWIAGPPLPTAIGNLNETAFANENMIYVTPDTPGMYGLGVTAAGPSSSWCTANVNAFLFNAYVDQGNGLVTVFGLNSSSYKVAQVALTPMISVPLPTSGLTNGATYHIMVQQQGGDLNNHLRTHMDFTTFPGNPVGLSSARGAYTWAGAPSNGSIPLQAFSNTTPAGGQSLPLHTWADNGARITTFVSATTPDQRLLGVCEATRQAVALNANTGFQAGLGPWTVSGGTATQSSAQTYEGGFAARIVPSGSASSVTLSSEIMPCMPGQWCTATGQLWFTSAVTSTFSMSITWYSAVSGGTQISTSSSLVSVAAATWTEETQSIQAPAGAYGFQIQATLSGTPSSSQIWYLDTVHAHYTYTGPQTSTVSQVTASGTWPAPTTPTGVVQLG